MKRAAGLWRRTLVSRTKCFRPLASLMGRGSYRGGRGADTLYAPGLADYVAGMCDGCVGRSCCRSGCAGRPAQPDLPQISNALSAEIPTAIAGEDVGRAEIAITAQ